jgi:hypothetical protein
LTIANDPLFDFTALRNSAAIEEYGRFQQHIILLEDRYRVAQFARAISRFPPGNTIVDVGAGTGVLALIGVKRGFKRAVLIEPSKKIALYARHLAAINGLSECITIIPSTLETVEPGAIPDKIDMIVTETLSSVLFGLGSWDKLSALADRLSTPDAIIPLTGKLLACLGTRNYATRTPDNGGQAILKEIGLNVDLFECTFRSGGNVYDKAGIRCELEAGTLTPTCIANFDFMRRPAIALNGAPLKAPGEGEYSGVILYWIVQLTKREGGIEISSIDPNVTSWYPFYVQFIKPIYLRDGDELFIKLQLLPIDAPYKYAIQLIADAAPISRVLYW